VGELAADVLAAGQRDHAADEAGEELRVCGRVRDDVEQHEAVSKDGTKIPYFIVKPEGMEMTGETATLMTGYGGFQIPRLPGYLGSTGKMWLQPMPSGAGLAT